MDKGLQRMIRQADKEAEKSGRVWMVIRARDGAEQVYPLRENLPEGIEIAYRTDKQNKENINKISMAEYVMKVYGFRKGGN